MTSGTSISWPRDPEITSQAVLLFVAWSPASNRRVNEYSWCMFVIFRAQVEQTLSDEEVETVTFKRTSSHSFTRTTPTIPFWFDAWNKFSVAMLRADSLYWILKQQPHRGQKFWPKEDEVFFHAPFFSLAWLSQQPTSRRYVAVKKREHFPGKVDSTKVSGCQRAVNVDV